MRRVQPPLGVARARDVHVGSFHVALNMADVACMPKLVKNGYLTKETIVDKSINQNARTSREKSTGMFTLQYKFVGWN